MTNDITIVIKTFERKKKLVNLLKSIEKYYANIPIIIVDDSKKNYKNYICNKFKNLKINYIVEEYDIGLSKGRNILIKNVKTKYFLLCDDDFEFDERTNLEIAKKYLIEYDLNMVGGTVYNRISFDSLYSILWILKNPRRIKKVIKKEEFVSIYNGSFDIDDNNILLKINRDEKKYSDNEVYKTDICSNFFLANTKSILKINGWTPEILKVGEHEFFFLKAKKNNLKIMYSPKFGVRHYPKKTFRYMKFRLRAETYFKEACALSNYNSFKVFDIDGNKTIYEYRKSEE